MTNTTDIHRVLEAYKVALDSPDPNTQNGAVIYRGLDRIARGCNTLCDGVESDPYRLLKPEKYDWIVHAERNCIYNAARYGSRTEGATMYCPWFACTDCAQAIIQSGLQRVVGHKAMLDRTPAHWKNSITTALQMLDEAKVKYEFIDIPVNNIRFNGKWWNPFVGYIEP